jgi:hypothetical protein
MRLLLDDRATILLRKYVLESKPNLSCRDRRVNNSLVFFFFFFFFEVFTDVVRTNSRHRRLRSVFMLLRSSLVLS